MNLVDHLGCLQFNEDDVFDEQVKPYGPRRRSRRIERLCDVAARRRFQPCEPGAAKRFIDFLKESGSQRVERRQVAANDRAIERGQLVEPHERGDFQAGHGSRGNVSHIGTAALN